MDPYIPLAGLLDRPWGCFRCERGQSPLLEQPMLSGTGLEGGPRDR